MVSRSASNLGKYFWVVTAHFLMIGNVGEDCSQGADSQRIVKGDGDVMLRRARGCEPQMLPVWRVVL